MIPFKKNFAGFQKFKKFTKKTFSPALENFLLLFRAFRRECKRKKLLSARLGEYDG